MKYTAIVLVIIGAAVGCATLPGKEANPCDSAAGHGSHALVCIDASFTKVDPNLVHVRSNEWLDLYITGSSGDLDVQFTADTPLHHAHHLGAHESHHYKIQAKEVKESVRRKYRLIDRSSGKEIDPEVMIDP
jgi:hypothetical protein